MPEFPDGIDGKRSRVPSLENYTRLTQKLKIIGRALPWLGKKGILN